METLNLMNLAGYKTGGTIHIVVNNQIGFTTNPRDSPQHAVLHRHRQVHAGADLPRQRRRPGGVRRHRELALEFRQQFKRDVVIDMVCYRKWGHNEGDKPAFTQPLESKVIEKKQPLSAGLRRAARRGADGQGVTADVSEAIGQEFEEKLAGGSRGRRQRRRPSIARRWNEPTPM